MTLNPHSPSLALILCSPYILAPSSSAASLPPPRPTRTARPRPRRTGARAATSGTASPPTAPAPPPPAKKHRALVPARPPAPPLAPPRGPPPARPRPRAPTVRCVRGGSVVWSIRVCTRARVWEMAPLPCRLTCTQQHGPGSRTRRHDARKDVLYPTPLLRAPCTRVPQPHLRASPPNRPRTNHVPTLPFLPFSPPLTHPPFSPSLIPTPFPPGCVLIVCL